MFQFTWQYAAATLKQAGGGCTLYFRISFSVLYRFMGRAYYFGFSSDLDSSVIFFGYKED